MYERDEDFKYRLDTVLQLGKVIKKQHKPPSCAINRKIF
jgi:hypothetical protein